MGFLDKVKGFLNIGGVKVQITKVDDPFPRDKTEIGGKIMLTAKSEKNVLSTKAKFVMEVKKKKGDEWVKKEYDLSTFDSKAHESDVTYPFTMKAGETKEIDFKLIGIALEAELADMGGALGAIGKLGKMVSKEKVRYFVDVSCDVEGTPFDPSDEVDVRVVAAEGTTA